MANDSATHRFDEMFDIIERSPALRWTSPEQRIAIASRSTLRHLLTGEFLFRQATRGESFYLMMQGELEVIQKHSEEDEELVIARVFQAGDPIGEMAAAHIDQERSASIRAAADTTLIEISFDLIDQIGGRQDFIDLSQSVAKKHLLHDEIMNTSHLYRILSQTGSVKDWIRELEYSAGDLIFAEGDPADHTYFILSGEVQISQTIDAEQKLLTKIGAGQMFGELGVINRQPRAASVLATTDLRLVVFDATGLRKLVRKNSEFNEELQLLRNIYMDGKGGIVLRWVETRDGIVINAVSVTLPDGRHLLIQNSSSALFLDVQVDPAPEKYQVHCFDDSLRRIQRTIKVFDNHIVAVNLEGPCEESGQLIAAVRNKTIVTSDQLDQFSTSGLLFADAPPSDIVCHCMQIHRDQLEKQIKNGCRNADELAISTGASTVCGSCRGELEEITEGSQSHSVRIADRKEVSSGAYRIRFVPEQKTTLTTSSAGQHIIVEGTINGILVKRPYTLTSHHKEQRWREITIRKERHGLFSSWLTTVDPSVAQIKISSPRGDFLADFTDQTPILLMVAGIGVTPALAIARSRAKRSSGPQIIIDHSARITQQLVATEELTELARNSTSIRYQVRRTTGGERIRTEDIAQLHQQYPTGRWMICGPERYQNGLESKLLDIGVDPHRIAIEHFKPPTMTRTLGIQPDYFSLVTAIFMVVFTTLILGMQWVPAELESWQQTSWGHWISGSSLLLYLSIQWWLPLIRWTQSTRSVPTVLRWHRRVGAFSPLLLILHGNSIGIGTLGLLFWLFISNTLIGVADRSIVRDPQSQIRYFQGWLFAHVTVSILLTALAIYHVWTIISHGGP